MLRFNLLAVYLASQSGKWNIKSFQSSGADRFGLAFGSFQDSIRLSSVYLTSNIYAVYQPITTMILLNLSCPSSGVRTAMLSINSMMFSLSMIVIFPLTGWLIDTEWICSCFLVLGLITSFFPSLSGWIRKMGKT